MNGEPFLLVTLILGFLWFAGSSGQDANGNCLLYEFYCPKTKTCDSILNSKCTHSVCKDLKMPCDNVSKCYRLSDRCDQVADCKDGVDELHCDSYRTPSYIKCMLTPKCDHITTTTTTTRPTCSFYTCDLGQTCYYDYEKCDGISKCGDRSDELDCSPECAGRLTCDDGRGCYTSRSRCDDYNDCSDGSDEADCPTGGSGLSVGPIVGALVGVIIITVLVVCLKSVMQKAGRRESPGAVAYHTAANYREANSMFQSSHTYNNNNNSGSSQSNPRSTSPATSANGYGSHSPYATGYGGPAATAATYPPQSTTGPGHFQQSDPSSLPYPYPVSVDSTGPESPPFAPPPAYETLFPQK